MGNPITITSREQAEEIATDPTSSAEDVAAANAYLAANPDTAASASTGTKSAPLDPETAAAAAAATDAPTSVAVDLTAAAATVSQAAVKTVEATSHPVSIIDTMGARIKLAEAALATTEHAAMISIHSHLCELRNKISLVGQEVSAEVKSIIEHLQKIL